jgi:glycosyltransferase involved in cell wall biosynthesis
MKRIKINTGTIFLTIGICSYNRKEFAINLINNLLMLQEKSKEPHVKIQIIICANGCTDGTYDFIKNNFIIESEYQESYGYYIDQANISEIYEKENMITLINVGEGNLSKARNTIMAHSKGEYIAFLDDDIKLDNSWLDAAKTGPMKKDDTIFGGKIYLWDSTGKMEDKIDRLPYYHKRLLGLNDHGNERKLVDWPFVFGGNFIISRRIAAIVGQFNSKFGRHGGVRLGGEEAEYFIRAKSKNFKFEYLPDLCVGHLVNQDRLKNDYLINSARGVGRSRAILPDRCHLISKDRIINSVKALLDKAEQPNFYNNYNLLEQTRIQDGLGEIESQIIYYIESIVKKFKTASESFNWNENENVIESRLMSDKISANYYNNYNSIDDFSVQKSGVNILCIGKASETEAGFEKSTLEFEITKDASDKIKKYSNFIKLKPKSAKWINASSFRIVFSIKASNFSDIWIETRINENSYLADNIKLNNGTYSKPGIAFTVINTDNDFFDIIGLIKLNAYQKCSLEYVAIGIHIDTYSACGEDASIPNVEKAKLRFYKIDSCA